MTSKVKKQPFSMISNLLQQLDKKITTLAMTVVFALSFGTQLFAQSITIPNFWDPNERFVRPDLSSLPRLKFLTSTDFPPFNFIDRNKRLSGFHVDLARAICVELDILQKCQIQALPWAELEKALADGEGDAIIAGLEVTVERRSKFIFSRPYMQVPARFVVRSESDLAEPIYEGLFKKTTALIANSVHQKYFQQYFGERVSKVFPTRQSAFNALKSGEVESVFTDGLSASFWLASAASDSCCKFMGGPYLSPEIFGEGFSIATKKNDSDLAQGFDYALKTINDKGVFKELYLKYFPLGIY